MQPSTHAARRAGTLLSAFALLAMSAAAVLINAAPASAATPSVTVSPSTGLANGQTVSVNASGFRASYPMMVIVECAKSATGANGCDTNDVAFGKTDKSGSYSTSLTIKSKFGSTDCTKVACIVQAHEGTSSTSGATGTSSRLVFGSAAKATKSATHAAAPNTGAASTPTVPCCASSTSADPTSSAAAGSGGGGNPAVPTGADTGHAVSTSPPLLSEIGVVLALLLLAGGLAMHLQRRKARAR